MGKKKGTEEPKKKEREREKEKRIKEARERMKGSSETNTYLIKHWGKRESWALLYKNNIMNKNQKGESERAEGKRSG